MCLSLVLGYGFACWLCLELITDAYATKTIPMLKLGHPGEVVSWALLSVLEEFWWLLRIFVPLGLWVL